MSPHERYAHPSVVLAVMELRHPEAGALSSSAIAKLKHFLGEHFPLYRPLVTNPFQAGINLPTAVNLPAELTTENSPRYLSRDRTTSVTFKTSSISVETTRYLGYETLRKLSRLAILARQEVGQIDGIERLGLRYLNEIRAPEGGSELGSWARWISPLLLGPAEIGDRAVLGPAQMQSVVSFRPSDERALVLRYGVAEGYAVDPGGELKRDTPPPSAFFLIDIDSFWIAGEEIPEFDIEDFLTRSDELHCAVGNIFEAAITDDLRKEVLRGR